MVIVSNAAVAFVPREPAPPAGSDWLSRTPRVGHLANLSAEKGLLDVLDFARLAAAANIDIEVIIGGRCTPEVRADLERLSKNGLPIRYIGPLERSDIERFYSSIDVFYYPSRYRHEAEPLVVLDALSYGVPVIASGRGCLGGMRGTSVVTSPSEALNVIAGLDFSAIDRGALRADYEELSHSAASRLLELM